MRKTAALIGSVLLGSALLIPLTPNPSGAAEVEIVDLVGDEDNFGFEADPVPCQFFDNVEGGEDDAFDREIDGPADEVEEWTHDISGDPAFAGIDEITSVTIEIPETFSDNASSTISFDGGPVVPFVTGSFAVCPDSNAAPGVTRTFTFNGADAAFMDDGMVTIEFTENDDDIAFDFSRLTVVGQDGVPVADAGPDQAVEIGHDVGTAAIDLDGSGSSDPDGQDLTYEWTGDFNGGTASGVNPTVVFDGPGTYEVTLEVTDEDEETDTDTMTVTVTREGAPPPPPAEPEEVDPTFTG